MIETHEKTEQEIIAEYATGWAGIFEDKITLETIEQKRRNMEWAAAHPWLIPPTKNDIRRDLAADVRAFLESGGNIKRTGEERPKKAAPEFLSKMGHHSSTEAAERWGAICQAILERYPNGCKARQAFAIMQEFGIANERDYEALERAVWRGQLVRILSGNRPYWYAHPSREAEARAYVASLPDEGRNGGGQRRFDLSVFDPVIAEFGERYPHGGSIVEFNAVAHQHGVTYRTYGVDYAERLFAANKLGKVYTHGAKRYCLPGREADVAPPTRRSGSVNHWPRVAAEAAKTYPDGATFDQLSQVATDMGLKISATTFHNAMAEHVRRGEFIRLGHGLYLCAHDAERRGVKHVPAPPQKLRIRPNQWRHIATEFCVRFPDGGLNDDIAKVARDMGLSVTVESVRESLLRGRLDGYFEKIEPGRRGRWHRPIYVARVKEKADAAAPAVQSEIDLAA